MNLQDTIEAVQRRVGVTADGDPQIQSWNAIANALGVQPTANVDATIRRVQRKVNVDDDGDPGPQTWGAIARAVGVLTVVMAPGRGILGELADIAETQIGTQEDAAHTNRGAAILKYQQSTNLGGQGWPWCAAFVDWVMQQFLARHISYAEHGFKRSQTASAYGLIDWAREQKLLIFDGAHTAPQRGDIVVYTFSHTGIVADVDPQDRVFRAIEGNTNDVGGRDGYTVARRSRNYGSVKQFIRLPELKAAA
jgi:CHAP domain